jgi:hypothetical protein
MNYKLFNDDSILAPLKCGTRYLEKIFGEPSSQISSHAIGGKLFIKNLQTIVVRQPFEHLSSALHTEIINKKRSNLSIKEVVDNFVSKKGTTHWDKNILKNLYFVWKRGCKNGLNVVELKELSNLLNELGYKVPEFDYEEYQFHHLKSWISKEDVVLLMRTDFSKEWEYLMSIVKSENDFYFKLNNKIITEIEKPKIKFI